MRRFPALPVLLVAALSVATLAGCSGGTDAPAPSAPAADAPLPKYATLADLGAATAAQQKIDKTAKITLNGGLASQSQSGLTGDGVLRFDDTGASMQITQRIQAGGTPQELELVVLPDDAFIRPPAGPAGLPPGKSWLRIRPTSTDPVSAQFNQMIQAIRDNADPTKSFARFGDAISIVETAEEQLDGLRTMRYKLRVDLAKAAERQPDPAMKKSLQDSVQGGLATLDYTLWVDAQNRLARVLVDQPLPQNQGTFSLDARYRDWGQPVQIDAPPADQVVER